MYKASEIKDNYLNFPLSYISEANKEVSTETNYVLREKESLFKAYTQEKADMANLLSKMELSLR